MKAKKRKRKLPARALTAYHEAAHAVIALDLGVAVKGLSIRPEKGSRGRVLFYPKKAPDPSSLGSLRIRQLVEARIQIGLAGWIGEMKGLGAQLTFQKAGAKVDMDGLSYVALAQCGSLEETDAYLNWLFVKTRDKVNVLWERIQALARALLEKEELNRAEILALWKDVTPVHAPVALWGSRLPKTATAGTRSRVKMLRHARV